MLSSLLHFQSCFFRLILQLQLRVLIMDIRNVEDSAQISIHLFYLHNKYYIMLLNLSRNICVILIVIRMDEGLTLSQTSPGFYVSAVQVL